MDPQTTPTTSPPTSEAIPQEKTSVGPLVGTGIVLVVLILGGLFLWNNKLQQDMNNAPPFILGDDNAATGLPPTSNSDAVADIESDISATNLDTVEANVESDMKAAEGAL